MEEIDNQSGVLTVDWLLFFKAHKSLAYIRNHLVFRPSWNFSCVRVLCVWINGAASQPRARTLLDPFTRTIAIKIWKTYWTSHPSHSFWTALWSKGEHTCLSQLQCYEPMLQISASPKRLLEISIPQGRGRRLLNVSKEENGKKHWVCFCCTAGGACTEMVVIAAHEYKRSQSHLVRASTPHRPDKAEGKGSLCSLLQMRHWDNREMKWNAWTHTGNLWQNN